VVLAEKERECVRASDEDMGAARAAIVGVAGAQPRGHRLREPVPVVAAFDAAARRTALWAHVNKAADSRNPFDVLADGFADVMRQPDGDGDIVANEGRRTVEVTVANTADRPIQVGSHFHFFEANRALRFDRAQAFGMRLNIPAGTAVRFEPGDEKRVTLVELAGARQVFGLNALTEGGAKDAALKRLGEWNR